ncbi:MAG: GNAT family N-acetyltransferase [Clostridia bacterium]|nr:GNAT family N-acetyltransferase [Clostridia bacterium]
MDANKNISFRLMTENDKDEYFSMSREFYAAGVTNSVISDGGREKFWKEIVLGEIVKGYFLIYGNEVAGYSICCLSASQEACGRLLWLDELYIKKQFRGKGIGTEFFRFLENTDEYNYIRLEVEHDNARAMKLYKSLGYADAKYISLYKKTDKRG